MGFEKQLMAQPTQSTRSAGSVDIWCRKTCTCPIERVVLVSRHNRRALQAPCQRFRNSKSTICEPRSERRRLHCAARAVIRRGRPVIASADRGCVNRPCELALPVLLQELSPESGTLENGLDEVVLLERLGQVLVHLGLDALLAITHHGVGCERDDGSALTAQAPLILANLGCGLKTALEIDSVSLS